MSSERDTLLEALRALRKAVIGLVWQPLGVTGDESDWFECQLCGNRSRDTRLLPHLPNCPMAIADTAIKEAERGGGQR